MTKMIAKKINFLILLTLVVIWGILGVVMYQSFFDRSVPSVYSIEKNSHTTIQPGEEVTVHYNISRLRSCRSKIERILQGTENRTTTYILSTGERDLTQEEVGKEISIVNKFIVPNDFQPGYYQYYVKVSHECNMMQKYFPIVLESPKIIIKVK